MSDQINKARTLSKSLGIRSAAGYLRNREYTLEQALLILLGVCSERQLIEVITL